jgi:hypothetical protein|tara:strand:+ start:419 stop:625 length:207 start_codon:yes stop_codon:yes gene_type:complete
MNKEQIVNHYFTNRAFSASMTPTVMSINLRNEMPEMSYAQAEKAAAFFSKLVESYMTEAKECADKLAR